MQNLAGDKGCDPVITQELTEAGIDIYDWSALVDQTGEVPTKLRGLLAGWQFKRAWYYWIATATNGGLAPGMAQQFHEKWGTQVRVDGHCGCPSPQEWCGGFSVNHYHIDTQEGLNAFAKMLTTIALDNYAQLGEKSRWHQYYRKAGTAYLVQANSPLMQDATTVEAAR